VADCEKELADAEASVAAWKKNLVDARARLDATSVNLRVAAKRVPGLLHAEVSGMAGAVNADATLPADAEAVAD
jgi:hypothetical protein